MPSDKEKMELTYKRFPRCPLCKWDKGYQFSGWIDDYFQCPYCGAKWLLHEWLSDKPMMELVEASKDVVRGTVVGHELLGKIYPVDFWRKIKVSRLRVEAKEVEKEPKLPKEVKKVREKRIVPPEPKPMRITSRTVVFIAFLINFFLGLFALLWIFGSIPKEFLGAFYGNFIIAVGFYSIILGACFLAVVYWVWQDDERLRTLEESSL